MSDSSCACTAAAAIAIGVADPVVDRAIILFVMLSTSLSSSKLLNILARRTFSRLFLILRSAATSPRLLAAAMAASNSRSSSFSSRISSPPMCRPTERGGALRESLAFLRLSMLTGFASTGTVEPGRRSSRLTLTAREALDNGAGAVRGAGAGDARKSLKAGNPNASEPRQKPEVDGAGAGAMQPGPAFTDVGAGDSTARGDGTSRLSSGKWSNSLSLTLPSMRPKPSRSQASLMNSSSSQAGLPMLPTTSVLACLAIVAKLLATRELVALRAKLLDAEDILSVVGVCEQ
mmetsp:Transcript_46967/g.69537  ORF Transcript_46967/g.69537 Transcript_46967/m.69537 type:complete len:290 (+) Transcript_46967:1231-2100(+)